MEAYITQADPSDPKDALTRLLAAIVAWLRALLAEHQAGLLPPAQAHPAPTRAHTRKARKTANHQRHARTNARTRAPLIRAPRPMPVPPRTERQRDMTKGLPRPRLVAPS